MAPNTKVDVPDFPKKLFYKINEVASITGVEAYVLRYWEGKFPMLAPEKDENDQRRGKQPPASAHAHWPLPCSNSCGSADAATGVSFSPVLRTKSSSLPVRSFIRSQS